MSAPTKARALRAVTQLATGLTLGLVAAFAIDQYAGAYRADAFADPRESADTRKR